VLEILDIKIKVRRAIIEDGTGFGINATLEGVQLDEIVKAINTALIAKGSSLRVDIKEKKNKWRY